MYRMAVIATISYKTLTISKSSLKSVTLFGVLQRLITWFSASVNRWKILTDHLGLYTIKKLSATRWETRTSSVRYQISAIHTF